MDMIILLGFNVSYDYDYNCDYDVNVNPLTPRSDCSFSLLAATHFLMN